MSDGREAVSSGLVDRMIRSSVDRALRLQPRRARRIADETRYSSPSARGLIDDLAAAARRLLASGLAVPTATRLAVRRDDGRIAVSIAGADLARLDGGRVETLDPARHPTDLAAVAARVGGAVAVHPPALLALATLGRTPDPHASAELAALAGVLSRDLPTQPGVGILPAGVAIGADRTAKGAVARLEAAERLAEISLRLSTEEET